jgi:hypothetical protein
MPVANVAAFPPAKPTIVEIMDDGMKTGQPLVAVYEKIAKFYPEKSLTEIIAAVSSELDRKEMEAAKLPAVPGIPRRRSPPANAALTAASGLIPQSRAAKRAAKRRFWEDFRAAVALDPDWYWYPDDSFCCAPDALYDTKEKLVAAYRAWIGKANYE